MYDEKWSRFTPRQRLNVDQSPLPFAVTTKRTYEHLEGEQQHNQPVDASYTQILKVFIGQAQRKWLDDKENAKKWYGCESSFSTKERRILITHWAGEAHNKLLSSEYDNLRLRVWQKTGCLMTANGSEDGPDKARGAR